MSAGRPTASVPSQRAQAVAIVVAGFGQNVVLTTVTTFVLAYLIQYAGISSAGIAVVTAIITVAKIVDAFTDPVMGVIIDLTRTRWGKLRPYILFSAAPVAALTTLIFAVPDVDEPLQLVYFGIVYLLWGFAYTVCDVPFWGSSARPSPTRRGARASSATCARSARSRSASRRSGCRGSPGRCRAAARRPAPAGRSRCS